MPDYITALQEIRNPKTKEFQPLLISAYTGDCVAAPRQYAGSPVTFAAKSTEAAAVRLFGHTQVVKTNPDADISPDNAAVITGIERPTITAEGMHGDRNSRRVPFDLYELPDGTKDEYDGTTGRYVQRVGKIVLNGTEAWSKIGTIPYFRLNKVVIGNPAAPVLSTHFAWGAIADNNDTIGIKIADNGTDIVLRTNVVTTVDALKAYLTDQAAVGTPVAIYYELAQPVISYHRADLACYDGDTTVTCSDPLATDMEVTVYDSRPAGDARTLGGELPYVYMQSNPNLLDNPFYTVWQRGHTFTLGNASYQYTADRWVDIAGDNKDATATVHKRADGGASIEVSTPNGETRYYHRQRVPRDKIIPLIGRQVTLSALIKSTVPFFFQIYDRANKTSVVPDSSIMTSNPLEAKEYSLAAYTFVVPAIQDNADYWEFSIVGRLAASSTAHIKAAKLELGPVSTLHLDPPPDYGQELIKCQRYCVIASYVGLRASVVSPAVFYFNVPTPVTMRLTPAIEQNKMSVNSLEGTAQTGFSFSVVGKSAGAIIVRAEKTNHGLKDAYLYCGHIGGQPTIFSADL